MTQRVGARRELVALVVAFSWGAGLLVGAVLAPAYQTESSTTAGTVTHASTTLVEENGWRVLLVVGIPLLAALIVGVELWRRRRASRRAGPIAWTCTGLLAGVNLLAIASFGAFILPVTVSLFIACATRQADGRARDGGHLFPI